MKKMKSSVNMLTSQINELELDKLKIISVSNIFGQAVDRVHNGESVSALFEF